MNVQIRTKNVDVEIGKDGLTATVPDKPDYTKGKFFRLHYSLMGEVNPIVTPLSLDFSFDDKTTAYRYDWVVGFSAITPWTFNWEEDLNDKRALCVQMLIDCGETGFSYTEVSAMLLGLQPSKYNASFLEKHLDKLSNSLVAASNIAEPMNGTAASLIKTSAVLSNFVGAGTKDKKNWFLYRFLDEEKRCPAVEWNIHKPVIDQYGPLLRGSIILAFHGTPRTKGTVQMWLRPRLALVDAGPLQYVPPAAQLEQDNPVMLEINPNSPQQKT